MRLTSPVLLLVLLAAVGCGGDEDTFSADYNRAVEPVAAFGRTLHGGPAGYERLAKRVHMASQKLARLTSVPDDARDEFDGVAVQLERVASALDDVATSQRQRDP